MKSCLGCLTLLLAGVLVGAGIVATLAAVVLSELHKLP